ncbi:MAG: sensor histidine kinase [Egibacteraceae bacterium]
MISHLRKREGRLSPRPPLRATNEFRARLRRLRPLLADAGLALALAALVLTVLVDVSGTRARISFWILLLSTLLLVFRRYHPLWILAATVGADVVATFGLGLGFVRAGADIALYTVAAHCERRTAIRAGLAAGLSLAVAILFAESFQPGPTVRVLLLRLPLDAAAWAFGAYVGELRATSTRLQRERESEMRRALAEEQARIARELHDVIAHNVSVMVVQAAAARDVFDLDPARAQGALGAIEATGRRAMVEIRRLLGAVQPDDGEPAVLAPQPGLSQLDTLIRQVRAAGLPVELVIHGEPFELPSGVDLSAYRIVQEALTNTLKHAHASSASIAVRYREGEFALEVRDNGVGAATKSNGGQGRGIIGMRERVALFGGSLEAGPKADRGFEVRARFPLAPEEGL